MAGNLQRSKAWIPPWVSTHALLFPLSRACFRPVLLFPSALARSSRRSGGGWSQLPKGSWGLSLCPGTASGSCQGLAPLPFPLPGHASGQERPQGLAKVVIILCPLSPTHPAKGGSHGILERLLPPRSPILPSGSLPQIQMSICVCLWGSMQRAHVWLVCSPQKGGVHGSICHAFLEASCSLDPGLG